MYINCGDENFEASFSTWQVFFGLTPTPTSKPKVVKIGLCITMISYQGNVEWLFHRNLVSCFSFMLNGEHQQQHFVL
jgi:hypothetical protein